MSQEKQNFGSKPAHTRKYNLVAHAEHRSGDAGDLTLMDVCIITQFLLTY